MRRLNSAPGCIYDGEDFAGLGRGEDREHHLLLALAERVGDVEDTGVLRHPCLEPLRGLAKRVGVGKTCRSEEEKELHAIGESDARD